MASIIYTGRYTGIIFDAYGLSDVRRGVPTEVPDDVAKELVEKYPNDYKLADGKEAAPAKAKKKPAAATVDVAVAEEETL